MNDKFTAVLSKVTDSAKEANKSFNENPQDLDTHFTEWVTFSANCLVTAVEDPVKRVGVLRDLLGQALFAAEGGADPQEKQEERKGDSEGEDGADADVQKAAAVFYGSVG